MSMRLRSTGNEPTAREPRAIEIRQRQLSLIETRNIRIHHGFRLSLGIDRSGQCPSIEGARQLTTIAAHSALRN
jgi:hypothetical protein